MTERTTGYGVPDTALANSCKRRHALRQERRRSDGFQAGSVGRLRMERELQTGSDFVDISVSDAVPLTEQKRINDSLTATEGLIKALVVRERAPWRRALVAHVAEVSGTQVAAEVLAYKVNVFRQATGWCDPDQAMPVELPTAEWARALFYEARTMSHLVVQQPGLRMSDAFDLQRPVSPSVAEGTAELSSRSLSNIFEGS